MLSRLRHGSTSRHEIALLIMAVLVGGVLRLAWPGDIEYKHDEAWTFEIVRQYRETGQLPPLGMPSSKNLLNPGLSVWVFIALDAVSPGSSPADLASGVQFCNVLALALLAGFIAWIVPANQREIWIWALFLAAVNPIDIRFHRKIWPPSLFPLPLVLMLFAWWFRDRRWGAFCWGLIGMLLGQIQMAGFILMAGVFCWMVVTDRQSVRWRYWFIGSAIGMLPMLNWFLYLASAPERTPGNTFVWDNVFTFKFFGHWISQPAGIGFKHAFGEGVSQFLAQPLWNGKPTYLLWAIQLQLMVAMICIGGRWLLSLRQGRLNSNRSATQTITLAVFWGYGILFSISMLPFFRHYLLVSFPFMYVWLASVALSSQRSGKAWMGRTCLAVLVTGQLVLSGSFLDFIHRNGGAPLADFGVVYDSPLNSHRLNQHQPTTQENVYVQRER